MASSEALTILVLQGPNLNLLGLREPGIYGQETLEAIQAGLDRLAGELGVRLVHHQSNSEGELVDRIHQAMGACDGIVFNPGAYTHTSIALRDALAATRIPFVEIHLSNVHAREPFRHRSMLADLAVGVVAGFGAFGYSLALRGLVDRLRAA